MSNFVCITAEEWRNLCSLGRIRLHTSRAVSCSDQFGAESYRALLSVAPDRFSLGDTSDLLIAEYRELQFHVEGVKPPGSECGVQWLLLEDVIRFFPLRSDDAWAFEADAAKAQVLLCDAAFESHWECWFKAQLVDQACISGLTLQRALGTVNPSTAGEDELEQWRSLAGQIVDPNTDDSVLPDFSVELFKSRDRLFDLVIEDSDSGSIFVSCPIEWVNLRSNSDILNSDPILHDLAHGLHEKYRDISFNSSLVRADDLTEFAALLRTNARDAFPGEWSPAVVAFYIRYWHSIMFGSVTPDEIVSSVRVIEEIEGDTTAGLLAFLFGATLGANKAHSIERTLHRERFVVDTTPPESSFVELPLENNGASKIDCQPESVGGDRVLTSDLQRDERYPSIREDLGFSEDKEPVPTAMANSPLEPEAEQ